jgi:hypothetical protein
MEMIGPSETSPQKMAAFITAAEGTSSPTCKNFSGGIFLKVSS